MAFVMLGISFIVSVTMVTFHAFALDKAEALFLAQKKRLSIMDNRQRVFKIMHFTAYALFLHWLEISIFGLVYYALIELGHFGSIGGAHSLQDYMYFSVSSYTSLGIGDLVPEGPMRILSGAEALMGLVMITWSATFAMREASKERVSS